MTGDPTIRYSAGAAIERREVLHGLVWLTHPVTVLRDTGDELAVLLGPGSAFTFPDHPFGPHPWRHQEAWAETDVLQLYRPDDLYSVWRFFRDGVGANWYLNFEAEVTRTAVGIETLDYGLDLVIEPAGGPWQWKDVDDPAAMVAAGRLTEAEFDRLEGAALAVEADLSVGRRWWSGWDEWHPPHYHQSLPDSGAMA